jgi:zinc protease
MLVACGHARPADPAAAPAPWPAEVAPPPAREPAADPAPPHKLVVPVPPVTPPAPAPVAEEPPGVAKDRELPGEGPPRRFVLPTPQRVKLASGAELLVVRRTRLPLTTVVVVWPSGASSEPVAHAGIATLYANLVTKGAGARTALELAAELEKLGAHAAATASWDATTVSLSTLTRSLDPALAILSDVVLRPRFETAEIERVRKEATTSLLQLRDSASTQATLAGARALYGDSDRYGELMQGSTAGLAAVTRTDLLAWRGQHLPISAATIIAVSDADPKALAKKLDAAFNVHPDVVEGTRAAVPRHTPVPQGGRVLVVDRPGAAQTEMRAFQPGPPRTSPDYFPLIVLNTILGGNFSSRLNGKLREEKGYTYGARSEFAFRRDGGPFVAGAPVKTAVTRDALLEMRGVLTRMGEGKVEEAELRMAKSTLQRSIARNFETGPDVALALALIRVYGLPDSYYATYAKNIEAVGAADIARVAKQLRPSDMTVVLVGDEKVIGPELKALGGYEHADP